MKDLKAQHKLDRKAHKETKNLHKKSKREAIFTSFKPWHAIFLMVAPTIITNLIWSSFSIFDKWIATQWGGQSIIDANPQIPITAAEALKIINIATTYAAVPSSIMMAFSLLVSTGTAVKFSISYGKNKKDEMSEYLGTGFLLSFIVSILFTIIMYFATVDIINFQAGSDPTVASDKAIHDIIVSQAIHFSRIFILATPLLFFANFWFSLLRSEGRLISNIILTIFGCFLNIGLDFLFVIIFKMGMAGTAYATVITWAFYFTSCIGLIYYTDSSLVIKLRHLKLKRVLAAGILLIGVSSLLQNMAQSFIAMITTKILNTLPPPDYPSGGSAIPVYVQLYGGIMPWLILINAPIIGVSQGARALVGYVYGTADYYRVWQIIWRLVVLLLVLLSLSVLLVVFAGQYMMNFFGVDLSMANFFKIYIIMQFAFYPLATFHFITIILYQGINRGKTALFAGLQRTVVMPIICLGMGYAVAMSTGDGFYFYLFIGLVDLFSAIVLFPLLTYTFFKARPFFQKGPIKDNPALSIEAIENQI